MASKKKSVKFDLLAKAQNIRGNRPIGLRSAPVRNSNKIIRPSIKSARVSKTPAPTYKRPPARQPMVKKQPMAKKRKPMIVRLKPNQKKALEGYMEVPRKYWYDLPKSTHIRYIDANGKFKWGGYIINRGIKKKGEKKGKKYLSVRLGYKKNSLVFTIYLHEVLKIWKKLTSKGEIEMIKVALENHKKYINKMHIFLQKKFPEYKQS